MRALVLSILLACGGSAPPPATPPPAPAPAPAPTATADPATPPPTAGGLPNVDELLAKMDGFKDKLCACPDQTCVEGVSTEMTQWAKDMQAKGMKDPQMSDAQTKRATAIGEDMGKCMKRISNMGG